MRVVVTILVTALLVACNDEMPSAVVSESSAHAPQAFEAAPDTDSSSRGSRPGLNGRSTELLNPDASTMVFLY